MYKEKIFAKSQNNNSDPLIDNIPRIKNKVYDRIKHQIIYFVVDI